MLLMRLFVILLICFVSAAAQTPGELYQDATQPTELRVADLLAQMTPEEKVGQMTLINLSRLMGSGEWDRGPLNEAWLKTVLDEHQVGALLSGGGAAPLPNTPQSWAETTNDLQAYTLEHSRLGIPLLYGIDAVHGHNNVLGATIYPHNLGLGASWNPELVEAVAERVAQDLSATGTLWNYAPVADVGRDARWGRFYETFSEDAHLAGELTAASVRGFQASGRVAATLKHFAGYGQPQTGLDRSPAFLDEGTLRRVTYPSFTAGIKAGALTAMANSGSVNGVPVHASEYLLTDVLRGQLGFEGMLVSDWNDVDKLVDIYAVAADFKDALAMSVNAGVDMYMVPHDAPKVTSTLLELVEEGVITQDRLDEAVGRILSVKFALGLFENPYVEIEDADTVTEAERTLARQAATESMTLLKRGRLPLNEDTETLLVVGDSADNLANQMGGWTLGWQGLETPGEVPPGSSILEALEEAVPGGMNVTFAEAGDALQAAQEADHALIVLGEAPYAEGEGDSDTLAFSAEQLELLRSVLNADIPTTLVVVAGRPLILPEDVQERLDSLLMAYLPGSEGGTALADVLFGQANPSSKLPFSWPRHTGQLPLTYDVLTGAAYDPLFAFGYGLSYTTFEQSGMSAEPNAEGVGVTLTLENTGEMRGSEVVQLYVSYPPAGVMTPQRRLVAFEKVSLEPGETAQVRLQVPLGALELTTDERFQDEPSLAAGSYTFSTQDLTTALDLE